MEPVSLDLAAFPFYNLLNGIGIIIAVLLVEADFRQADEGPRFPAFLITLVLGYVCAWPCAHIADYFLQGYRPTGDALEAHVHYGYTFYGGLLGACAFLIPALSVQGFSLSHSADRLAPVIPLAHAFGRLGCWFAGCCYGKVCTVYSFAFRFPTQLSSAAFLLALFAFLQWRTVRVNRFYIYLWAYSIWRFLIEFVRDDPRGRLLTGFLSPAQEISVAVLFGTALVFVANRHLRQVPQGLPEAQPSAGVRVPVRGT